MNITFHRALYGKHCKNKVAIVTQILTPSFQNLFQKSKNKSKNSLKFFKKKVFSRHLHSFSSFQRLFKKFKKTLKKKQKKKGF
jgi:hypothetical protein